MTITKTDVFRYVCKWLSETSGIRLLKADKKIATYYYESEFIRIKVVDVCNEIGNKDGAFMMETKETFYNWDNMYYSTSLPHTKEQFQQILLDMQTIQEEQHLDRADNFYRFFP
ncbi:hypothetical protein CN918_32360 [Priestia megaterium]|nr:hypothetical protein CN918_32360 [Priestia megaterium]